MQQENFNSREQQLYHRHLSLPEIGEQGQSKLKRARVLIVGMGGLGCPIALYLAGAGVGTLGLVDFDRVDLSNLQRQVLYGHHDVGKNKAQVAKLRIQERNPEIQVTAYPEKLNSCNIEKLFNQYQIIVDGTDNLATRYLLNDAAMLLNKDYVYGSVFRFEGQLGIFSKHHSCYRCLHPLEPVSEAGVPNCAQAGVLGVLPGTIGLLQATETIKIILGRETLRSKILLFNALSLSFQTLQLPKNPHCPICGNSPTILSLEESPAYDPASDKITNNTISPSQLLALLKENSPLQIIDVRSQQEYEQQHLQPAIHLPLSKLETNSLQLKLCKNLPTVVYCHAGNRSSQALKILYQSGLEDIRHLEGGLQAWKNQCGLSFLG